VPLLDIGLIVLAIGPAAGKRDMLAATPRHEDVVEELSAVVGMEGEQGHRQGLAGQVHGAAHALVALAPHGLQLGPAGGDVDGEERGEVEAVCAFPAVGEQIRLQLAGEHIGPLPEGAQRDLGPQGGEARAGRREAVAPVLPAHGAQKPIDGRGTDPQEGGALLSRERHLVVPLQGLDQSGRKGAKRLEQR
jgi:hypothetical protein